VSRAVKTDVAVDVAVDAALDSARAEMDRLGLRAVAFRRGEHRGFPGLRVQGRGGRAGQERVFHVEPRTLLLRDKREAWLQTVATRALEVEA
jgi:hypothetical protein